jgi:hypothetical protein
MYLHVCNSIFHVGIAPVAQGRVGTQLNAQLPEDQMSANQLEIKEIQDKWSEIRHLSREEAQTQLEGEWLEAYNRFFEKYDDDMVRMTEIAEKVQKMIQPEKLEKKTKGQKRRDLYAVKMARETLRAANRAKDAPNQAKAAAKAAALAE